MLARLERVADALARCLDLATAAFDEHAGQCSADAANPYVVTMLPAPADYFMACGETGACRARCLAEYSAFATALAAEQEPQTQTVTVADEVTSLYFSVADLDAGPHRPPFEVLG